jgi:hypothetical protein
VLYLLDADTLIRADSTYYPLKRFPVFWDWLHYNGATGSLKVPQEQFDEVTAGQGDLVEWLNQRPKKDDLLLPGALDPALVQRVIDEGYAQDLDANELAIVGRDPFLVAYGLVSVADRIIVSFETSAPSKQRANKKIPDICRAFGLQCVTLFDLIEALDFTTGWARPA